MPDLKISQLTDGDPALATDEIPAARSGANVKLTAQSVADLHADAVDSVNGATGVVVLDAADVGAAAASFTTIAVSGQDNVVADSTADTLTLAAGSGIGITTDAATDTVTITASGGAATPSDFQPAIVTNSYYFPQIGAPGSNNADADLMVAWPIWFSEAVTWTRIGVYVNTAGTTEKIRIGIYQNTTGNVPGALVVDAGEITLSSTGEQEKTISAALSANTLYWLVYVSDDSLGNVEFRTIGLESSSGDPIGFMAASWLTGAPSGNPTIDGVFPTRTFTYGALPDPFGTPDGTGGESVATWLRKV